MMAQKQAVRQNQAITLKGSTAMVTEFFEYGVNNILYQRGVYPSDEFRMVKKYGIPLLMTSNDALKEYIQEIMKQVREWLMSSTITRLVLAIKSRDTGETLERWQFDVQREDPEAAGGSDKPAEKAGSSGSGPAKAGSKKGKEKTEKDVQGEIREIMKQITSSVTFLPILDDPCTFTLLAYTSGMEDDAVPAAWGDADPHLIDRGKVEQVRLRSFSTNVHSLEVSHGIAIIDSTDFKPKAWSEKRA